MNRNYKYKEEEEQTHKNNNSSHLVQSLEDGGGSGKSEKADRSPPPFSFDFWKMVGTQSNDNLHNDDDSHNVKITRRTVLRLRTMFVVVGLITLSLIIGLDVPVVTTQAVLHADDAVLSAAMDMNEEALAHVLNSMDIGE